MTGHENPPSWDQAYARSPRLFGDQPTAGLLSLLDGMTEGGLALDLGCGDGRDTMFLLRSGFSVLAVDSSSVATSKLRSLADAESLAHKLEIQTCRVEEMAWEAAKYDLVIATTLLDHLTAPIVQMVSAAMIEALRPGGVLFAEVHTVDDPAVRGAGPVSEFAPHIAHYFGRNELLGLFHPECWIRYYRERIEWDYDHGEPHQHGFATIFCQKR